MCMCREGVWESGTYGSCRRRCCRRAEVSAAAIWEAVAADSDLVFAHVLAVGFAGQARGLVAADGSETGAECAHALVVDGATCGARGEDLWERWKREGRLRGRWGK